MVKKKISKKLESVIKDYIQVIKADNTPVERVILFGSHAKGTNNKWSDVDLAIISPKFTDRFQALHYLNQRTNNREPYYIEPHGLTPADLDDKYDSLAQEIKRHGIELSF